MKSGIAAAVVLAFGASSAYAQSDNVSGFYVGGGWGAYDVQVDDIDDTDDAIQRIDDDDNAWRVFGGWRFNPYLSVELAYVDFGEPGDQLEGSGSSGNYKLDISGLQPAVYGTFPIGPVELFAKLGYYFYDVDLSVNLDDLGGDVFSSDTSEEAWSYGGGVGVTILDHLHFKLEYEKIDTDLIDDLDSIWLTAAWRF
jgi:opacity protein-like surface antigen